MCSISLKDRPGPCIFNSEKVTSLLLEHHSQVTHCFPFCLGCQDVQNEP